MPGNACDIAAVVLYQARRPPVVCRVGKADADKPVTAANGELFCAGRPSHAQACLSDPCDHLRAVGCDIQDGPLRDARADKLNQKSTSSGVQLPSCSVQTWLLQSWEQETILSSPTAQSRPETTDSWPVSTAERCQAPLFSLVDLLLISACQKTVVQGYTPATGLSVPVRDFIYVDFVGLGT